MANLDELPARLDLELALQESTTEKLAVLITGPPGIGKSTVINTWSQKVAKEKGLEWVDYEVISTLSGEIFKASLPDNLTVEKILANREKYYVYGDVRLTSHDQVDLTGILRPVENKYAKFIPLDLAVLLSTGPGLLNLDEYTNESRPSMQAASLKILRDHKIGGLPLHKDVMVVALGNTPKNSNIANKLPKPVRSRFVVIDTTAPTIEGWAEYMNATYKVDGWDHSVLAYLYWKPQDMLANYTEDDDPDGVTPPADPRGWSYVARGLKLIKEKVKDPKLQEIFLRDLPVEKLGSVGSTYNSFVNYKVAKFEELVENPKVIADYKAEQVYLTAVTIAERLRADPSSVTDAVKIINYIASDIHETRVKGSTRISDQEIITIIFTVIPQATKEKLWSISGPAAKAIYAKIGRGYYRK